MNYFFVCKGVSTLHETRKQIIIKEIIYWKKHHLLPEHYCDFLLAIYTQGNGIDSKIKKKSWKQTLYFLLFVPMLVFLLYFTELSLILQMVFGFILIFSGLYLAFLFLKKGLLYQIPLIIAAFTCLFISVEMTLIFSHHLIYLYFVLFANCFLWLLMGWKLKQLYFTISGIIGLLLIISSFFIPFSNY